MGDEWGRWRDVDLARGRLAVTSAKTDAGERVIDLSPDLLSELKRHKADAYGEHPGALVFPTSSGAQGNRWNVSKRILGRAVAVANAQRAKDGLAPIVGVTNHTLRRTFASLCYESGASPAYVMNAMGHTSSALALEIYARRMSRERDTGARMDSLIRGAEKAQTGTNDDLVPVTVLSGSNESDQEAA